MAILRVDRLRPSLTWVIAGCLAALGFSSVQVAFAAPSSLPSQRSHLVEVLPSTVLVSGSPAGSPQEIYRDAFAADISAHAGVVSFYADRRHLVPNDNNGAYDVFVKVRSRDVTRRVSVSSDETESNGPSFGGALSSTGRYVAFASQATNLVRDDTNQVNDIFVRDRLAGTTARVSLGMGGAQADGDSFQPSISANGRYVAFISAANNLAPGDPGDFAYDVFVRDRLAGTTERVSVGTVQALFSAPSISADGRHVGFVARLTSDPGNLRSDCFVRDLDTQATQQLSLTRTGGVPDGDCTRVVLSGNGQQAAFTSDATNMIARRFDGLTHVFLRDRSARTLSLVSVGLDGALANNSSTVSDISTDGKSVVYSSLASNLVATPRDWYLGIFVRDIRHHANARVNVAEPGVVPIGRRLAFGGSISADRLHVAFTSYQTLSPEDTQRRPDAYVRDRAGR